MTMLEWHSKDVKKMLIQKRNGLFQDYDNNKIETAIKKAFCSLSETIKDINLKISDSAFIIKKDDCRY